VGVWGGGYVWEGGRGTSACPAARALMAAIACTCRMQAQGAFMYYYIIVHASATGTAGPRQLGRGVGGR
jgi:hypothetical protein